MLRLQRPAAAPAAALLVIALSLAGAGPRAGVHARALGAAAAAPAAPGNTTSAALYARLESFADIIDVRALWRALGLPPPPSTLCHVGLLGWHCHNTSLNPWNPASLLPPDRAPPMPADATCIVCPSGWKGRRTDMLAVARELPGYVRGGGGRLPPGLYDGAKLAEAPAAGAAQAAPAAAAAAGAAHGSSAASAAGGSVGGSGGGGA